MMEEARDMMSTGLAPAHPAVMSFDRTTQNKPSLGAHRSEAFSP